MKRKYTDKEIQELAASYSLGNLGEEEKREFETLLGSGDENASKVLESFAEVLGFLNHTPAPLTEPPGLRSRLFDLMKEEPRSAEDKGFVYVRENEGEWVEVMKGVRVKSLYEDLSKKYSTVLVKMDPGATFPDHVHAEAEECYIIEGDIHMGGHVFGSGDYIRADAHSVHEAISTVNGCFLLVQASQENEMIA